jgi:uncharacterized membrane protein
MATIRNPIEWGADQLRQAAAHADSVGHSLRGETAPPIVHKVTIADLRAALREGLDDFLTYRTDILFIGLIYPIAGLILARAAFHYEMLPLLFPLMSGFALLGPVAAVGLYEMSRRHERGEATSWLASFAVLRSPSFGAMLTLGIGLLALFVLWLFAAQWIYLATLGPEPPASAGAFLRDVMTTEAGWTMVIVGGGVGFLFALLALSISVVSFPLLLDRDVGLKAAVSTSLKAMRRNPVTLSLWGLIVAVGLALGSLPLLLGLIVVVPVLGHATWHLYRKVVG